MKKNIILTGFMGTGKTTLGKKLARKLDYQFIDTDVEIERRAGKTVGDIFEDDGEASFRQMEQDLVRDLARQQGLIISTGGGLVMNPDNVTTLNGCGLIVCLTATPEEIFERVSAQQQVRPLLLEDDPRKKIEQLLTQREPVYSQFEQLSTSGKSPDELVARLLELASQD